MIDNKIHQSIIGLSSGALGLLLIFLISACSDSDKKLFATADGSNISLAARDGRVVLINYWAIWCAPCREEIPELNRLLEQHRDKVLVFGVNIDGKQGAQLHEDIARLNIRFPVLIEDPSPALRIPLPKVVPSTWVLDDRGHPRRVLYGPQKMADLLTIVTEE